MPPKKKIVFFDWGNVLTPFYGYSVVAKEIAGKTGVSQARVEKIAFDPKRMEALHKKARYWRDYARDVCSELREAGGKPFDEHQLFDAMQVAMGKPNERMFQLARELKEKGVTVAVLSNLNAPHYFHYFQHEQAQELSGFDRLFVSCYLGKQKPARNMFEHALRLAGGPNLKDAILIDDTHKNLRGFRREGGRAFHYKIPFELPEHERERELDRMDGLLRRKLVRAGFL